MCDIFYDMMYNHPKVEKLEYQANHVRQDRYVFQSGMASTIAVAKCGTSSVAKT